MRARRAGRHSRRWSSFLFQCLLIGILLLVPLYFTEQLPKSQLLTFLDSAATAASTASGGRTSCQDDEADSK